MSLEPNDIEKFKFSSFVTIGKDFISLLRDGSLVLLASLLLIFPKKFNNVLRTAGFTKGNVMGFDWEGSLEENDLVLQEAHATITHLQEENKTLMSTLSGATSMIDDNDYVSLISDLKAKNESNTKEAALVQMHVSKTLDNNIDLYRKITNNPEEKKLSKSDYVVGLQTLGYPDDQRKQINAKIEAAGYELNTISSSYQDSAPSWFASRSTVFYYSKESKSRADRLANLMKELTGDTFQVSRGAGLRVNPDERETTFYVHYINDQLKGKKVVSNTDEDPKVTPSTGTQPSINEQTKSSSTEPNSLLKSNSISDLIQNETRVLEEELDSARSKVIPLFNRVKNELIDNR